MPKSNLYGVNVLSNFTEQASVEEIIDELDKYIPCLDEDRQFIKKYRSDFIYHYNNNFYNLALFSFHYIYMFIINTSMVKYYAFDIDIIKNQTGNKLKKGVYEPFVYFGLQSEKKVIHNNVISQHNKDLHQTNVDIRNNIAHSSGYIVKKEILINYINNCFNVLYELQRNVLIKCFTNKNQHNQYNYNDDIIESLCSGNTSAIENLLLDFMIDFHISYNDLKLMEHVATNLNAIIYFIPYLFLDENGSIYLNWDEKINLHKAIYDDFNSKYIPLFYHEDSEYTDYIMDRDKIKNEMIIKNENTDINTIYNVLNKLISKSEYWIQKDIIKFKISEQEKIKYGINDETNDTIINS